MLMRIVILYHPQSDHAGKVEDYAHEYHMRHQDREIEKISLETKEGWEMAKLYDAVRYPAVLALADDGELQGMWQGDMLPLMGELDSYMASSESSHSVEHPDLSIWLKTEVNL